MTIANARRWVDDDDGDWGERSMSIVVFFFEDASTVRRPSAFVRSIDRSID